MVKPGLRGTLRNVVPVLSLATLVLCGCGSADPDPADPAAGATPLAQPQLEKALLTLDDLSEGFEVVEAGDDAAGGTQLSLNDAECLSGLELDDVDEAAEAEVVFDRVNLLTITSTATSYSDDVADAFDEASDAIAACSDFTITDDDGSGLTGTLDSDTTAASDDVDAQINVRLKATQQPSGMPVEITFSYARVGNDVVAVTSEGLGGPSAESFQELMKATADRLAATHED